MIVALDDVHQDYSAEIRQLNGYLDHLHRGMNLTSSEKLDKELIETWVLLVQEHELVQPGSTGSLTRMLRQAGFGTASPS